MFPCQYKNCFNIYRPGSKLSYFEIPSDFRRDIWIKHSGVPELKNKPGKIKFCELHFFEKDILRKGDKSLLSQNAILKSL